MKSIYQLIVCWEKLGYFIEYSNEILEHDLEFPESCEEVYGLGRVVKDTLLRHLLHKKAVSMRLKNAFVAIYASDFVHGPNGTRFKIALDVKYRR